MTTTDPVIEEAFQQCAELTRRRARNFYYGLKLTPQPRRSAMFAIYAWMRMADDIVDSGSINDSERAEQLETFKQMTHVALSGRRPAEDSLWIAMADTASRYELDPADFDDMLAGQVDDLHVTSCADWDQLRTFCYRVASTVGRVCISIWGYEDPAAVEMAVDRGIAFQLTNILRDFREDHESGRVYLPAEDFTRHGLRPEDVIEWSDPDRCTDFILEQVARARDHYIRSAPLDGLITPECVPTLWAMTAIYRGILEKIASSPFRVAGDKRIRLSALRKTSIAFKARRMIPARMAGTAR